MDMVTNGAIITDALNYVNNKTKELSSATDKELSNEQEEKAKDLNLRNLKNLIMVRKKS